METERIYLADCRQMLKEIERETIDLIVTDPPYGTTDAQFDKIDFPRPEEYMTELMRVIKPHGAVCVFSQLPFSCDVINAARKWYRYEWIWEKPLAVGFLNAHKMPMRCHENILVFYKKLPTYNPQYEFGDKYTRIKVNDKSSVYGKVERHKITASEDGRRYPRDVIKFNNQMTMSNLEKAGHPTQKPRRLYEYLIRTYSNENEIVLDAFAGSGTCAIACQNTNRRYICIEKDEKYYQIALNRINKGERDDESKRNEYRRITLWA